MNRRSSRARTAPGPLVPTVIEETPAGDVNFDIYSRLLSERIVFLGTPINDQIANLTIAQLLHLEADDPDRDLSLYLNSPGGSVYAALAIYDTMEFVKPHIQVICIGSALGMGALLLAAGTEGKRIALANAKILIHQPSSGFEGGATDIEIQAQEVISLKRRVEELFAKHTGQSLERVRTDMDRDFFLSTEEAKEYGIIDSVIARTH